MTQDNLTVVAWSDKSGHRYKIMQGSECLLVSGHFDLEADALRAGRHIASDPVALFDFIGRTQ
jgi:hypothetical protein